MIKAIETRYKGYRFRSRLEARWAVFFDALDIRWEYEKEGYNLGDVGLYLPDFWLVNEQVWVEVKPSKPSEDEQRKCFALADQTSSSVIMICGSPSVDSKELIDRAYITQWNEASYKLFTYHGWRVPNEKVFRWDNFVFGRAFFDNEGLYNHLIRNGFSPPPPPATTREDIMTYVEMDKLYWRNKYGSDHKKWSYGLKQDQGIFTWQDGLQVDLGASMVVVHPVIDKALAIARAARFEHGESGGN